MVRPRLVPLLLSAVLIQAQTGPVACRDPNLLAVPAVFSGESLPRFAAQSAAEALPYTIPFPPVHGDVSSGMYLWTGTPSTNTWTLAESGIPRCRIAQCIASRQDYGLLSRHCKEISTEKFSAGRIIFPFHGHLV